MDDDAAANNPGCTLKGLPCRIEFERVVRGMQEKAERATVCTDKTYDLLVKIYSGAKDWAEGLSEKEKARTINYSKQFGYVEAPLSLGGGKSIQTKTTDKKKKPLILVKFSKMYEALVECHAQKDGHCGIKKTYEYLREKYTGIPRPVVAKFITLCFVCKVKAPHRPSLILKPILAGGYNSRRQMDLVTFVQIPSLDPKFFNYPAEQDPRYLLTLKLVCDPGVCDPK
jgi:hypothetical protein